MSRAQGRRYRVRLATLGAVEVSDSTVEFALEVEDTADHPLASVPVVAGSFVHPLDGATELRPLSVDCLDKDGALIAAFTEGERWRALGRLLDIQYQDIEDDPDTDPWVTYGTGRCSGLDEGDGPGKFNVEISDESWVARRGEVFTTADTTAIWPSGVRGIWRGMGSPAGDGVSLEPLFNPAFSFLVDTQVEGGETFYRLRLEAGVFASRYEGREIHEGIVQWFKDDLLEPQLVEIPNAPPGGNWKHTRLSHPTASDRIDWDIISFGGLTPGPFSPGSGIFDTLEDPTIEDEGTVDETWIIHVWVRAPDGLSVEPAGSDAWFYAPTAPPSSDLPLHLGVSHYGIFNWLSEDNPWTQPYELNGFIHVADLTRRLWDALGVRYDATQLYELEQDTSFPALAPRIFAIPDDPERLFQMFAWGPLMLVALKDVFGRRILKDLRPPSEDADLTALPTLDATNSKHHRWRIVGREMMNSILWKYLRIYIPGSPSYAPNTAVKVRDFDEQPDTLDWLITRERALDPYESDNIDAAGRRQKTFQADWLFADPASPTFQVQALNNSGIGQPFIGDVVDQHSAFLLQLYQDGPFLGRCDFAGSLAETMSEGDYAIVDCSQVKIPNAATEARTGFVLVLILSLTRFPERADAEYLVYRPVLLFACPDEDDPETWLYSPLNEITTMRMALTVSEPLSGLFTLTVTARKNEAGGQQVDFGVDIYEGTTLRASFTETDISNVFTAYDFMLSSAEQAAITDWDNLFVEITRGGETYASPESDWRRIEISNIAGSTT